jgi:hypothetical protein
MAFSGGPTCLNFRTPIQANSPVSTNQKPVTIRKAQCSESPEPFQWMK